MEYREKSRLLVIEGLDGSGKKSQFERLVEWISLSRPVNVLDYPRYGSTTGQVCREYQSGAWGDLGEVDPYISGLPYAIDRMASFWEDWGNDYELGGKLFVANRYTTSNMIFKPAMETDPMRAEECLRRIVDLEWDSGPLPEPDAVILLKMYPEISRRLIISRYGGDESKMDINERNLEYQRRCLRQAYALAARYGWHVVDCDDGTNPLPPDKIAKEVLRIYQELAAEWFDPSSDGHP